MNTEEVTFRISSGPLEAFASEMDPDSTLFVVGNKGQEALGQMGLDDSIQILKAEGSEPSLERTANLTNYCFRGVETIVSIGGGSVIDFAKGVVMIIDFPDLVHASLDTPSRSHGSSTKKSRIRHIAVPTRAGSGAEISGSAVFTRGGAKFPIHAPALVPYAIHWDVELLSEGLLANINGILDILGHSIESLLSNRVSPVLDSWAAEAVRIAVDIPGNHVYTQSDRLRLLNASLFAGVCQDRRLVSLPHALAHAMPYLPHGNLVGNYLNQILVGLHNLRHPITEFLGRKLAEFGLGFDQVLVALNFLVNESNRLNGVSKFERLSDEMVSQTLDDPILRFSSFIFDSDLVGKLELQRPLT